MSFNKFELSIRNGMDKFIISRDSIVCGDVYLILGQSNSHPTNDSATFSNVYCRSFGKITGNGNYDEYDPKDTTWGISNAHGFGCRFCGDYMVGVWGLKLQELILNSFKIPTCFINVGIGGSKIEENLKNETNPYDLKTMYGKLLYRTIKSGVKENIKGIFWYQGEANSDESWAHYEENFNKFYQDLKTDFPSFKKLYLFQTRPGCDGEYQSELRNVQRLLSYKKNDIEIVSTTAINYHNGCHYYLDGYNEIAEKVFYKLKRDFYNVSDDPLSYTPDIRAANFLDKEQRTICLVFSQNLKIVDTGMLYTLKHYFYTFPFRQTPHKIYHNKDSIILYYAFPNYSNRISYLPNKYYNNSSDVYEGPFLSNDLGIGVVTFISDIKLAKIGELGNDRINIKCYPNPAQEKVNIKINNPILSNLIIKVTDISGREVKEYVYHSIEKGSYETSISLINLSSGTYFITLKNGCSSKTAKIIIVK